MAEGNQAEQYEQLHAKEELRAALNAEASSGAYLPPKRLIEIIEGFKAVGNDGSIWMTRHMADHLIGAIKRLAGIIEP